MSEQAPHVRVYQSIFDDPKFVAIVDDDHHLATWLRLLLHADAAWPLAAALPVNVRRASIRALTEAGVVDVSGPRYRIHGLDAERQRRQDRARANAKQRFSSGTATAEPLQSNSHARASVSVSISDVSPVEGGVGGDFDSLDVYHELTGFRPWGQWSGDELKAAIRDYGDAAVTDVLRAMYGNDSDRDTLWKRAKTQLAKNADRQREEGRANGKHRPKAHAMTDEERTAALAEIPGGLL